MTSKTSRNLKSVQRATAVLLLSAAPAFSQDRQPNILLILADDLGYSDIGAFGSEISTPNLDRLAKEGKVLTDFHAAAVCNITRLQLMSGIDNNIALDPKGASNASRTALRHDALTMAEVMDKAGYTTMMAGKWDLGQRPDQWPSARGFEHSFAMLPGTADHYNQKPLEKRQPVFAEGERQVTDLPADYYSTRYFTDRMLDFLKASESSDKPFFAYLAYTAPHFPLQAPQSYIDKYDGVYDAGYAEIHDARLKGMKASGIWPQDMLDAPLAAGKIAWNDWPSTEEQQLESRRMAVYAAMVDYMDEQIGRVIDALDRSGRLDNTLIIFASDNGASDEWRPPVFVDFGKGGPDNSYRNLGLPGSYFGAGPGWGWVSGTPFKSYKTHAEEGGHSVPAIAWFPKEIKAGSVSAAFSNVRDLLPTFADFAGIKVPTVTPSGAPAVPVDGRSMKPMLLDQTPAGPHAGEPVAFHDGDHLYLFLDQWKYLSDAGSPWQLYDLSRDRGEQTDLATTEPAQVQKMSDLWAANEKRISGLTLPK